MESSLVKVSKNEEVIEMQNATLDCFIRGELIDLCIPTEGFALSSNWYSWFNDEKILQYIDSQGIFPNTRESQRDYFKNLDSSRLVLIMVDKVGSSVGVISLSKINFEKKACDIALIVSNEGDRKLRPFISLEAMALMTSHGFEKLGMMRINAGQHINLKGWQKRLELIGYKLEGLHINMFVKGSHVANVMSISASYNDFEALKSIRGGGIWDGFEKMKKRTKSRPKECFCDEMIEVYQTSRTNYYKKIFDL